MAEQQAESRRVVVETPTTRREEVHSEATRYPERNGISGAALAAIVVGVIALAAIIILFALNRQDTANENLATTQQQPTTIVQQPAQQPPIIVQQPAAQPPVIINGQTAPATGGTTTTTTTSSGPDDATVQAAVDKRLSDDPMFSSLGIIASVVNGKATLTGTVKTENLKTQIERAVWKIKGVKEIDNQITIG
ncbi:MAG: BON domain-containing protein [Acidobacteriota bacterium]